MLDGDMSSANPAKLPKVMAFGILACAKAQSELDAGKLFSPDLTQNAFRALRVVEHSSVNGSPRADDGNVGKLAPFSDRLMLGKIRSSLISVNQEARGLKAQQTNIAKLADSFVNGVNKDNHVERVPQKTVSQTLYLPPNSLDALKDYIGTTDDRSAVNAFLTAILKGDANGEDAVRTHLDKDEIHISSDQSVAKVSFTDHGLTPENGGAMDEIVKKNGGMLMTLHGADSPLTEVVSSIMRHDLHCSPAEHRLDAEKPCKA